MSANVSHQLSAKIISRSKDASGNAIPLDLTEPEFDLVQPGAVGRRVVDLDAGVLVKPRLHLFGLVSREVVDDQMDLTSRRLGLRQTGSLKPLYPSPNSELTQTSPPLCVTIP